MRIPLYQVDAFASRVFAGNPAAVCPLEEWLDDGLLQAIAEENHLSETAFFVPEGDGYRLRWFTPVTEVDLCGHATLATAFVLFHYLRPDLDRITFSSRSGPLSVIRNGERLSMDFPALSLSEPLPVEATVEALGVQPVEVRSGMDLFVVLESEAEVRALQPDLERVKRLGGRGLIVTARGEDADFVSRFFAPACGIPEDPVTGSAHCALTPYWTQRLGQRELRALQLSARGGELFCEARGDRVRIAGRAVRYLEGAIFL